jgi:hypothetical protein
MTDQSPNKSEFLHPRIRYRGEFTPENLVFDANLQEFAQKVSYICSLETSGKLETEEAYQRVKQLWEQLDASSENLGIIEEGESPSP